MIPSQRMLITGAAGFVGSHLAKRLLNEGQIVYVLVKPTSDLWRLADVLDRPNLHLAYGDLMEKSTLETIVQASAPEFIFHLAASGAYHWQNNPNQSMAVNIFGTLNLIQACEKIPYQRFINIGSSSEYGFSSEPMSEHHPLKPNSYYAVAKAAQSLLAFYEATCHDQPIVTARLFSVFGPFEDSHKLLPTLFKRVVAKKSLQLTDPESAHDFIYIDDVIDCLLLIAQIKNPPLIFNIGTGVQTSLAEVVSTLEKVTQHKLKPQWGKFPTHRWDTHHWVADMGQTSAALGWQAQTSFSAGLQKNWEWFVTQHHLYETN